MPKFKVELWEETGGFVWVDPQPNETKEQAEERVLEQFQEQGWKGFKDSKITHGDQRVLSVTTEKTALEKLQDAKADEIIDEIREEDL